MHIVHQENSVPQRRQQLLQHPPVKRHPTAARCPLQAIQHPLHVPLRLQPPQKPSPNVRQRLVIQIHRILRPQQQPQPKRPRLLQQNHHRLLRWRIRCRRQIAKNLIHVKQRPQTRRPALLPHPTQELIHQHRHKKHPLTVTQMRNAKDRNPRLPFRCEIHPLNIQRFTLQPHPKPRTRQQVIQLHRQIRPLRLRQKRIHIHHPHLPNRRLLNRMHQHLQRQVLPLRPKMRHDVRK